VVYQASGDQSLYEIEQSPGDCVYSFAIFAHVVLRCYLALWNHELELLQQFGCHVFKLCTTLNENEQSTSELLPFSPCNFYF